MNTVIKGAVVLAVVVTAMSAGVILGGMHRNPITGSIIPILLAIVINLVVVFLALRETAPTSDYIGQLRNGLGLGVLGGVLVGVGAWILLALVFPDAIAEMREGAVGLLRNAGLPQEEIDSQLARMGSPTPLNQALPGVLGTLFTSIFGAAIIGAFVRRR